MKRPTPNPCAATARGRAAHVRLLPDKLLTAYQARTGCRRDGLGHARVLTHSGVVTVTKPRGAIAAGGFVDVPPKKRSDPCDGRPR
jgi:hypothetical protein